MRMLLARAGDDRYAFDTRQLSRVLSWPLEIDLPTASLYAAVGLPGQEPDPRALMGWRAGGVPFLLRVPGALLEDEASDADVLPVPPMLFAPGWVRGFVPSGGALALLLDLPALGDAVLAPADPLLEPPP